MDYNHTPSIKQAIELNKSNNDKIIESLNYILYVCEDILDSITINKFNYFIKKTKEKKYTSGFLFYIIKKIGEKIELNSVEEVKYYINLITEIDVNLNKKIITHNEKELNKHILRLYSEINDDVYKFRHIEINDDDVSLSKEMLEKSLTFISKIDNELFKEINEIVREFYIFSTDSTDENEIMYSGSDFNKLGTVFLNKDIFLKDLYFSIDKIIHESAHQILLSIMITDEIVMNSDEERYYSPLRSEPRTMNGIYHAAFVVYRILIFFNKLYNKNINDLLAKEYLLNNINIFNECYSVIAKSAKLSQLGKKIITSCRNEIQDIQYELYR